MSAVRTAVDENNFMNTKIQNRLPKYRRSKERFGPLQLTTRDHEILGLVHSYRHVWVDHLQALIPGSDRQLARRVQGLFHHAYLARFVPPSRMRLQLGSPKMVYALDTAGAKVLAEARGISLDELGWHTSHNRRMEWFVEHQVMTADFHAVLELALRGQGGLRLDSWRQDKDLRGEVEIEYPDGDRTFRVAPDAHFAAAEGGTRRNFFLEIDRGTEEHRRLRSKFEAYRWYLSEGSGYHDEYENSNDVRVLVVTTSEGRLERMLKTLSGLDQRGKGLNQFWFTTADRYTLKKPSSVLAPIWRTFRGDEEKRLFNVS